MNVTAFAALILTSMALALGLLGCELVARARSRRLVRLGRMDQLAATKENLSRFLRWHPVLIWNGALVAYLVCMQVASDVYDARGHLTAINLVTLTVNLWLLTYWVKALEEHNRDKIEYEQMLELTSIGEEVTKNENVMAYAARLTEFLARQNLAPRVRHEASTLAQELRRIVWHEQTNRENKS